MMIKNKIALIMAASGAALSTAGASAAVDVSAVVSSIGEAAAPIAAIGAAVLTVKIGARLWRWISSAAL